ncbi:MAG TPA: HAMP domain-containing sensor histidine kinase [Burkholderiales bacterium]|nr:HAMP domain-containing sensor histidine kinase [Burkholderiales bacterium]
MSWLERFVLTERGPWRRYGVALALALGSLALVHLLHLVEGTQLSSLAVASVVLSALYGGLGPALLDAAVTAIGIDYYYAAPLAAVFDSWTSVARVLTYVAIGVLIAGVVAALRDAHRRLHGQLQQVEQAKRARENMLAIVSHDLRSPLTAVLLGIGYVKRAAGEEKALAGLDGALDAIHRSAESMKRLVDDLLDAARIEAGRFSLDPSRQDVLPILEDAVESARLAAEARRVSLELQAPAGQAHLARCDRQRLTQVLANLIGNAVKFSPEGARVEVRLADDGEWLRIDVRDWGPGIAEKDLPNLFGRYWQAAETAHLGTGLGLYIARAIVESHGGRIAVASRAGEGTTFSVYLRRDRNG